MQVKAFARQDGALLSLLWISSFACLIYLPTLPISNIMTLSTPFFIGWRLVKFRNYALDGYISFRRGFAYSVYTFFYASLIFALAQYLYFAFLDNGTFVTMLTDVTHAIAPVYKNNDTAIKELHNSIAILETLTPIQWVFMFLIQNLFIGLIASIPIASTCSKSKSTTTNTNHQ